MQVEQPTELSLCVWLKVLQIVSLQAFNYDRKNIMAICNDRKKRKHIAFSFRLIYELEFCYRTSFPEFIFPAQITELIII